MKYHEYGPHVVLQDTVKCFWVHEGTFPSETEQDITPDGCVELLFNFGDPYFLRTTPRPTPLPVAVIVGFQNKTLPLLVHGTVKVVAARLFAWGAMTMLRDNVTRLTNTVTALGDDWNVLLPRIEAEVTAGNYEQAARTLEEFLLQQAVVRTFDTELIRAAAKHLHFTKGQYRIADLADHCHTSVRQLQRGFGKVVGTSPKNFARTLRFQEAQRRLMFDPEGDLTALAHDCGYFDQAHFIKDFKAFAGKTPSEYAEEMRSFQEILKSKDVVFLQSPPESDE